MQNRVDGGLVGVGVEGDDEQAIETVIGERGNGGAVVFDC